MTPIELPAGDGAPWGADLGAARGPQPGWRYAEIPVSVSGPGCYAVGVAGADFGYVLTIGAA